mgnify:FL=1
MDFYRDKDEVLRKCEEWNKVGQKCKDAGIQMVYHNHFHEFQHFGDERVIDILLENLDEELIKYEVDNYWVMRSGTDPIEHMKRLGKRIVLLHQKDFTKGYEDQINLLTSVERDNDYVDMDRFNKELDIASFTEIGSGIMDIQTIINTANENCDVEYIILEQDFTQIGELESIKKSMEQLKKYSGITW